MKTGEIIVFDKVYVDFKPLKTLSGRDVSWVPGQRRTCSMKLWDNSHCRALCLH